jgi:hypothetical protein
MPHGPGKISLSLSHDWQPQVIDIYDDGTRPVIGFVNKKEGLDVSYILFPNDTGAPASDSCRDAVVNVILRNMAGKATIKDQAQSTRTVKNGLNLSTVSYFIEQLDGHPIRQQELFGFFGDSNTCAEIHISKALAKPSDKPLFDAALNEFSYDPKAQPAVSDYGAMTMLFIQLKQPDAAVLYYDRMLREADKDPASRMNSLSRRLLTDQLSMAYGISGNLDKSRALNEAAIAHDPDYPLYYYNLACADAEQGNAAAARTHLQQAFDRRANTLPGESLPDPTRDDSLLKLKSDSAFWTFLQSLPKA